MAPVKKKNTARKTTVRAQDLITPPRDADINIDAELLKVLKASLATSPEEVARKKEERKRKYVEYRDDDEDDDKTDASGSDGERTLADDILERNTASTSSSDATTVSSGGGRSTRSRAKRNSADALIAMQKPTSTGNFTQSARATRATSGVEHSNNADEQIVAYGEEIPYIEPEPAQKKRKTSNTKKAKNGKKKAKKMKKAELAAWEVDDIQLTRRDLERMTVSDSMTLRKFDVETGHKERFELVEGALIWIVPDADALYKRTKKRYRSVGEIPDILFDVAEVEHCLILPDRGKDRGFLKVRWLYDFDQVLKAWKGKLPKSTFESIEAYMHKPNEMVRTDEMQYISVDSFAGPADGIEWRIEVTGLERSDEELLKPVSSRKKISGKAIRVHNLPELPFSGSSHWRAATTSSRKR